MHTLPPLDLHIYATQSQPISNGTQRIHGIELASVAVSAVDDSQMPASFEDVGDRLSRIARMFFELDGSFVCSGQHDGQRWQIDGMLYDRNGHVQRLELLGQCPLTVWQQILSTLQEKPIPTHAPEPGSDNPPTTKLVAHLRQLGCFVTVEELDILWSSGDNHA